MSNINVEKVIARKTKKAVGRTAKEITALFVEYVLTQLEALKKTFPTIIIPADGVSERVVGVSYSSAMWTTGRAHMSSDTHNIELSAIRNCIHVGYGANSARGKSIPYDPTMNKTQLRKVFKQALELLVKEAYWKGSDYYKKEEKNPKVWYKGEVI